MLGTQNDFNQPVQSISSHFNKMEEALDPSCQMEDISTEFGNTEHIAISKNKLKKLRREQQYEENRERRKTKRKEKLQEKKKQKRAARGISLKTDPGVSASINGQINDNDSPEGYRRRLCQSVQLPVTIIIDCGFDDLMLPQERTSLAAQLTRCYSDNSKAPFKTHLAISSFEGHLKDRFDNVLSGNHKNWKGVRVMSGDFFEASKQSQEWMKEHGGILGGALAPNPGADQALHTDKSGSGDIIYLTSDSPDTLTELRPYSTYIIGGLVDRNRHKGICYKRAIERGMRTAKLPIGEYMQMASRFVLATNHVSEIMVRWLELGDWGEAFERVIPKRKGGVLKSKLGDISGADDGTRPLGDSMDDDEVEGEANEDVEEGQNGGEEDGDMGREIQGVNEKEL